MVLINSYLTRDTALTGLLSGKQLSRIYEEVSMRLQDYQDQKLAEWKEKNKARLLLKYGASWYNEIAVLNMKKKVVRDAYFSYSQAK